MIISTELEIGKVIGKSRIYGEKIVKIDIIEIIDISETNYQLISINDMEINFLHFIKNLYNNYYNNSITIELAQKLFKKEYDKNRL